MEAFAFGAMSNPPPEGAAKVASVQPTTITTARH